MKCAYTGEPDSRAIKDVLGEIIPQLCQQRDDVFYLDADLMGCIGTVSWGKEHPETAVDVGIAEANLIGIAAGMAAEGFRPIVHSFGPFASRRCFDQVFLSCAYAGNDVTILGSDAGITAEYNGGTHMPFEDAALYRVIPGATVIDVSDSAMMADTLKRCIDMPGVKYLRFGRKKYKKVYEDGTEFPIGQALELRDGKDITIIAAGIMVSEALKAAEILAAEGIDAAVLNVFTLKPLDRKTVIRWAEKTSAVLTAENHNCIGGLYSAVAEVLAKERPTLMDYVAVEDRFGEVGPIDYLAEQFGLTADNIAEKARKLVASKK